MEILGRAAAKVAYRLSTISPWRLTASLTTEDSAPAGSAEWPGQRCGKAGEPFSAEHHKSLPESY
jgi:hypothetical protein